VAVDLLAGLLYPLGDHLGCEHFAVVCELSQERIQAVLAANDAALVELSLKFEEKLREYDRRIKHGD